ncbi:hypothetical protein GS500_23555 [Rhodococcus hoagii]|nr:hypothetical protein [Prescottella equi]
MPTPQPVESAVADAISDRYTEAAAEPEPEPEPVLQVPQNEHGESLTSPHWRSGTLVPAQRPDGSTVYVSPGTAARYRGEDAEQVPAAGEPNPARRPQPTPSPSRSPTRQPSPSPSPSLPHRLPQQSRVVTSHWVPTSWPPPQRSSAPGQT